MRNLRLTLRKFYKPLILLGLVMYFSYHIFQGRHGLLAWGTLSKNLDDKKLYLSELKQKKETMQHKVDLMGSALCKDLLEEEAKKKLGVAHKNEVVLVRE